MQASEGGLTRKSGIEGSGPYKLDGRKAAAITRALRKTMRWSHAAAVARVSERQLLRWRRRGAAGEEPYHRYFLMWEEARALRAMELEERIDKASESRWVESPDGTQRRWREGNWFAAAWVLERCQPEKYSTVAALREDTTEEAQASSKAARLSALRHRFNAVQADDPDVMDADGAES